MDEQIPGRDPDRLPDSGDPSGLCPRCGRFAHFATPALQTLVTKRGGLAATGGGLVPTERVAVLRCSACLRGTVVIEVLEQDADGYAPALWRGVHWWPPPGSPNFDVAVVPPEVIESFHEGERCVSVDAPNGAATMFRNALAWIVRDKGLPDAKGDLKSRIQQLVVSGGLPAALGEWADHLRLSGNAGAHPEQFGTIALDEAKEIAALTATLIEQLYVIPAQIARRREQRHV